MQITFNSIQLAAVLSESATFQGMICKVIESATATPSNYNSIVEYAKVIVCDAWRFNPQHDKIPAIKYLRQYAQDNAAAFRALGYDMLDNRMGLAEAKNLVEKWWGQKY